MLYILTNLKRGDNQWTYGIIDVVKKELTRRRMEFMEVTDIKATIRKAAAHADPILIPTPFTSLVLPIVEECNKLGVQVILPNGFLNIGERYRYHCVRGDFYGAVTKILWGLHNAGKDTVAIYGTNTNAQDDILITDAFLAQNNRISGSVFCNDGSIKTCFNSFFEKRHQFNAVICVNDYVAIDLIERLRRLDPAYLDALFIVSFSNTLLSRLYNTPFTSLAPDMEAVGCAVGDIYKIVKRNGGQYYRAVTIYVDYKIYERGTTKGVFQPENYIPYESKDVFFPTIQPFDETTAYNIDPEVARLPRIEIFLNRLTKVELSILGMLLQGYTNARIVEELYLSAEALRYHFKKMRSLLDCGTKEELREKLKDVLDPQHIEEYLLATS